MRLTYKFRVNPNKCQRRTLEKSLDLCRWVYNETLALRKNAWETEKKAISLYDSSKYLTDWKKTKNTEIVQVHSQALQEVQKRVELAYKAFFRRVKAGETPGYPRFKGYGRYDSFTYPQSGFGIENGKLRLSKIGDIKINLHREMRGDIKTLTMMKDTVGNWYACFSCEIESSPTQHPNQEKAVGIDMGLTTFATLSDGETVENPRFFRREEKRLANAQRKLSAFAKDAPERGKYKWVVSKIHLDIANKRKDFAHKLSKQLVEKYGIIAFEKLSTQRMMKNHCLAKSIGDASWNQLIQFSLYKAEEAGTKIVLVDPRNTTKKCSRCGVIINKTLAERVHVCTVCGLEIDRDLNASYNILALGLQCLGKIPRSPLVYEGE